MFYLNFYSRIPVKLAKKIFSALFINAVILPSRKHAFFKQLKKGSSANEIKSSIEKMAYLSDMSLTETTQYVFGFRSAYINTTQYVFEFLSVHYDFRDDTIPVFKTRSYVELFHFAINNIPRDDAIRLFINIMYNYAKLGTAGMLDIVSDIRVHEGFYGTSILSQTRIPYACVKDIGLYESHRNKNYFTGENESTKTISSFLPIDLMIIALANNNEHFIDRVDKLSKPLSQFYCQEDKNGMENRVLEVIKCASRRQSIAMYCSIFDIKLNALERKVLKHIFNRCEGHLYANYDPFILLIGLLPSEWENRIDYPIVRYKSLHGEIEANKLRGSLYEKLVSYYLKHQEGNLIDSIANIPDHLQHYAIVEMSKLS